MSHSNSPTNPILQAPPALVLEIIRKASVCVHNKEFEKALEVIAQLDAYHEEPDADPNVLDVLNRLREKAHAGLTEKPKLFGVLKRRASPPSARVFRRSSRKDKG